MARRASRSAHPWDVVEEVRKKASSGWPAGLTLLTGEDAYHLDTAQRLLLEGLLSPDEREMGLTVYGEGEAKVGSVVAAARSAGMFASRRVVLVRDGAILHGEPEPLVAYAQAPPPQSHLIVRMPKLDARLKLHQALGRGTVLEFTLVAGGTELADRVHALAAGKGLRIRANAAEFLAGACGGDLYRVDGELEKLQVWLGPEGATEVNLELVRNLASGGSVLTAWMMAEAILRADRAGAWNALQDLLDAGEEPLRVLGALAYRARQGLQADRALLAFPSLLLDADRTLKSRGIAPSAVLGILLERMIQVAADRRVARGC